MYDTPVKNTGKSLKIIRADLTVLQLLASAFEAERQVDLKEVASHEQLSIPISSFETDDSMRNGVKSSFINALNEDNFNGHVPDLVYTDYAVIVDVKGRIKAI